MKTLAIIASLIFSLTVQAQTETPVPSSELQTELENFISTCNAEIGVAVISDCGETICVNGELPYPLHSVAKLHQAIAVADYLNCNKIPLGTEIAIQAHELQPDTFSPLRDRHPSGDFTVSIAELLKFSLQQSDNNACDLLFNHQIGIEATNAYIHSIGIEHFAIRHDERAMHLNPKCANENWSTPQDAAKLIYSLFTSARFDNPYHRYVKSLLWDCKTGKNRLAAPLSDTKARLAHKTGTGFDSKIGHPQEINDVGFVELPNRRHYAIAVFVKNSENELQTSEKMIANISDIVFRHFVKNFQCKKI